MWLAIFVILIFAQFPSATKGNCTEVNSTWANRYIGALYTFQIYVGNSSASVEIYEPLGSTIKFSFNAASCGQKNVSVFLIGCQYSNEIMTFKISAAKPLTKSFTNSQIRLGDFWTCTNITLNVKDCSQQLDSGGVIVTTTNPVYNSAGKFDCFNSAAKLFYSNSSQIVDETTTCQSNAIWARHQGVQCWQAPNPTIKTSPQLTIAGGVLTLNCSYNDVLPVGSKTIFYISNTSFTLPKGELLKYTLNASDNGIWISCQAVTPYTEIFNDTGTSSVEPLYVAYPPYQVSPHKVTCLWQTGRRGSCNISYFENPPNSTLTLTKNETEVSNDASTVMTSFGTKQTFHFMRSLVTSDDNGTYVLNVSSRIFPDPPLLIQLQVIVSNFNLTRSPGVVNSTTLDSSSTNVGAIVGGCIGGLFAILIFTALGMYCYRNHNIYISKGNSGCLPTVDEQVSSNNGNVNGSLSLEGEGFYIEPMNAGSRPKPNPCIPINSYSNLEDNVNVKFGEDSYIELSPMEDQIPTSHSQEYEAVNQMSIPTYEAITN